MSLHYHGNCEWEPAGNAEPSTPPNELPTIMEPWLGRSDKTALFRAQKKVGTQYLGGYIIENTPKSNYPFPGMDWVDLKIATPPDFNAVLITPSLALTTTSKSVKVTASSIITGETTVNCSRELSYYAPEVKYSYFASAKPDGPRFSQCKGTVRIIRQMIKAVGPTNGQERIFFAVAPAALVAALTMPLVAKLVGHEAEPIPGTPWYRCTDTVRLEYEGDGGSK